MRSARSNRCPATTHPLGIGEWPAVVLEPATELRMGTFLLYLVGTLERTNRAGGCTFTRYGGTVWQHGFADDLPIGQFAAERFP